MSSILNPLVERLRAAGSANWEAIADAAGVAKSLPRKLACRDRTNPTVDTIQPLIDFFAAVDRGERELPYTPRQADADPPAAVAEPEPEPALPPDASRSSFYMGDRRTRDRGAPGPDPENVHALGLDSVERRG